VARWGREERAQLQNGIQDVGVWRLLQIRRIVSACEHADIPADSGIVSRFQVEDCVAHIRYEFGIRDSGTLHRPVDKIRGRSSPPHIVSTNHGIHKPAVPFERRQKRCRDFPVKSCVQSNANSTQAQPRKQVFRTFHFPDSSTAK